MPSLIKCSGSHKHTGSPLMDLMLVSISHTSQPTSLQYVQYSVAVLPRLIITFRSGFCTTLIKMFFMFCIVFQARCRRNFSNARGILACGESVASLARTAGFLHSLYQIAGRSGKRLNTQARCRRNFSNARGILACGESVASLARTAGFLHSLYQIAGRTESTPRNLAEREGFEPPEAFTSTVFKTAALDRSAISPNNLYILTKGRGVVK